MRPRRIYLGLCILGFVVPTSLFFPCFVGVSLGLPLFLYQRQAHLDRAAG